MERRHISTIESPSLFEQWDETGFFLPEQQQHREVQNDISESALKAARRILTGGAEQKGSRYVQERAVADIAAEIDAYRHEHDREDAYSELGGGLQASLRAEYGRRFEFIEPIDAYQTWHTETRQAVEQFRLFDMTSLDFQEMTKADRRLYSLHLFSYTESFKTLAHLIRLNDGNTTPGSPLEHRFGRSRSPHELNAYAKLLAQLYKAVDTSGILDNARSELELPQESWSNYQFMRGRTMEIAYRDRKKNGPIETVYEKGKFRVGRVG